MVRRMQLVAAALIASGALIAVPLAEAQQRQAPSSGSGAATSSQTVSDAKLDAAAMAITRVSELSEKYEKQFQAAPPEDRERIANEADVQLEKAVKDSGLSVQEYNSIVEIAQADPEVQDRLLQRLKTPPGGSQSQ